MTQPETQSTLNRYAAAVSKSQESSKNERVADDQRAEQIHGEREAERVEQEGEPATQKQLEFLMCLEMPIPQGLTKQAASRLIDEGKARRLVEKLESF